MAGISIVPAGFLKSYRSLRWTVLHLSISLTVWNSVIPSKRKTDWLTEEWFHNEVIKTFQVKSPLQPSSLNIPPSSNSSVIKGKAKVQCCSRIVFLTVCLYFVWWCRSFKKYSLYSISINGFFQFYFTISKYPIKYCLDFSMLFRWIRVLVSSRKQYPIFISNYIFNWQIRVVWIYYVQHELCCTQNIKTILTPLDGI